MINISLFRHSETETFTAGQLIFDAGETGKLMYVVLEGEVDILVGHTVVETAGPGSIVGEMALIDHSPRSATTRAKTDCKLAPVDQKRFEFLVQNTPYFSLQVMEIMANRLRRTNQSIAQ